jgi:GNAT superfamily N-acetyltransferase
MITIRPAAAAELPALSALISGLFALEPDFVPDDARQMAGLAMLLADPGRSLVLAAVDESPGRPAAVIGMLSVQLVVSTAEGGWSGLLEDVVVAASHRGQGIGRRLVAAAEEWAVDKGATRMQLLADQENTPALAFYGHLGYDPTRMICRRKKPLCAGA